MLRRRSGTGEGSLVRLGPLHIDTETYQVTAGGRPLDLTFKEFELLRFLALHPGRVYTRPALLREVWGYDFYGGTRTVDVHVRRLRAKLGPEHEGRIETVRGGGYRAAAPSPTKAQPFQKAATRRRIQPTVATWISRGARRPGWRNRRKPLVSNRWYSRASSVPS